MRILFLGGTRFIGPAVVRRLAAEGHEVILFHRGQTHADLPKGTQKILGNRHHLEDFAESLRKLAPDAVIDMLPVTELDARRVAGVFHGHAGRLISISSADVYRAYGRLLGLEPGPPDPVPLTEDAPLREKLYPYRGRMPNLNDYEKILVERVVMGTPDLPGTVLRLPMVYGPRDGQHRLFEHLKRMDDRRPAILLDEGTAVWRCSRGYVDNVAAAIARAAVDPRAAGRVYNVADATPTATSDWVRLIARATGWGGEIVIVPRSSLPAHLDQGIDPANHLEIDASRIGSELGHIDPVPVEEAVRLAVEWERANPPSTVDPARFDYAAEDRAIETIRKSGPQGD